jgi:hypothetical protein
MAIRGECPKEIGKFYQNKKQWNAIGYYEKSNAKSMDIDMETNLLCFNRTEAKEFESSKKSDGYGGCFPRSLSFIIIPV